MLAKFFLRKFVKEEQKDFQEFSAEAEQQLLSYDWPGNVRQLQNTIHNLVILNTGKVITNGMITAKLGEKTIPNIQSKNMVLANKTSDISNCSSPPQKLDSPYKAMQVCYHSILYRHNN